MVLNVERPEIGHSCRPSGGKEARCCRMRDVELRCLVKSKITGAKPMGHVARKWLLRFAVGGYLVSATPAFAYTQCPVTLSSIYAGDGGNVWLNYTNGGSAYLTPSNPDKTSILALAMTALAGSRQMIVRYTTDGADCTSAGRNDLVGVYLM